MAHLGLRAQASAIDPAPLRSPVRFTSWQSGQLQPGAVQTSVYPISASETFDSRGVLIDEQCWRHERALVQTRSTKSPSNVPVPKNSASTGSSFSQKPHQQNRPQTLGSLVGFDPRDGTGFSFLPLVCTDHASTLPSHGSSAGNTVDRSPRSHGRHRRRWQWVSDFQRPREQLEI